MTSNTLFCSIFKTPNMFKNDCINHEMSSISDNTAVSITFLSIE